MEKKIVITITPEGGSNENVQIKASGLSAIEVMGFLRYLEKKIWMQCSTADKGNTVIEEKDAARK